MAASAATEAHFAECADGAEQVNMCAAATDHECALSCLSAWLDHVRCCSRCQAHAALDCCDRTHCDRVRALWDLRAHVAAWCTTERIPAGGCVLEERLASLEALLRLDFAYITYTPPSAAHLPRATTQTFALLDLARRFQRHIAPFQQRALDGIDLHMAMRCVVKSLAPPP